MIGKNIVGVALLAALFSFNLCAEITTPRIFSDGMILQSGTATNIWGKSAPNARVELRFSGKSTSGKSDVNGKWKVSLSPLPPNSKPAQITIFENGKLSKTIKNVLVGEIWVLGGQSNMERRMNKMDDFKECKARAKYPNIRYFKTNTDFKNFTSSPAEDSPEGSIWLECSPDSLEKFSAIGFYFAEALRADLKTPVGLIFTALGGSPMCAWIPDDEVNACPYFKARYEKLQKAKKSYDFEKTYTKWLDRRAAFVKSGKPKSERPNDLEDWFSPIKASPWHGFATPCLLYNNIIAPLKGTAFRGVLWYQGEADDRDESAKSFCTQFTSLIKIWRKNLGKGGTGDENMPFYFVQLPSMDTDASRNGAHWEEIRAKQEKTSKQLNNVEFATAIDTGAQNDVHPTDKTRIGKRLEKIALANAYGKNVAWHAPRPDEENAKFAGDKAELIFETKGGRLYARKDMTGFEVLIGNEWKKAHANLDGNKLSLTPAEKTDGEICGARYLWTGWAKPLVSMYGENDFPVAPFLILKK